jgi:hypothetical protein
MSPTKTRQKQSGIKRSVIIVNNRLDYQILSIRYEELMADLLDHHKTGAGGGTIKPEMVEFDMK